MKEIVDVCLFKYNTGNEGSIEYHILQNLLKKFK